LQKNGVPENAAVKASNEFCFRLHGEAKGDIDPGVGHAQDDKADDMEM